MSERRFEVLRPQAGHGRIVEVRGEHVAFASNVAAPPGSMLEAAAAGVHVQIKVRSCRREPAAGDFRIEGRFLNLSRTDREKLSL